MLDADLANLYEVETKYLKRQVQRNIERFPEDFMFQLTSQEFDNLRCQIGTSNVHGGTRYLPYAFTEQGIAMLSGVLNSPRAVSANIAIMRAFVKMRGLAGAQEIIKRELALLKHKSKDHDEKISAIFLMLDEMAAPPEKPKKQHKIGFIHYKDQTPVWPSHPHGHDHVE